MSLEENIKHWVRLDDQLKLVNEKLKEIREQKNNIEENILVYVEKNNLENATAKITGGKLKFIETKQTAPLTLKFIEECLHKTINNPAKVKEIIAHMKEEREIKYVKDIKRYYDKE
jgi:hypothetical protein